MVESMLPEKFLERMQQMLGEEYEAFLNSFAQEKYQALRLNSLKVGMDGRSASEKLAETGHGHKEAFAYLTKVPWAENGYYYRQEDQPGKHPFHDAGVYYIQEPSAMAPAELLEVQPGERVLDLCAAPGGKSTQIAAKLQGRGLLVSNEINPSRAKILSENVERMGICNACVTNEAPERLADLFPEYFDRILVDAPCSGEGMFRKNEAACGEWSPENVALCAERQDGILDCAAAMLRPGGRLVYSTCTFAPEENEGSIKRFLQRHEDFSLLSVDRMKYEMTDSWNGIVRPGHNEKSEGSVQPEHKETSKCSPKLEYGETRSVSEGIEHEAQDFELEGTLRLWPHRIKGEGHFAAVLQKSGIFPEDFSGVPTAGANGRGKGLSEKELGEMDGLAEFLRESLHFPADSLLNTLKCLGRALGMGEGTECIRFGENLYLVPGEMPSLKGLKVLRPGLHIGEVKKKRFEPSHAFALALPPEYAVHTWEFAADDRTVYDYLSGGTFPAEGEKGWYMICVEGFGLGWGKLAGGIMKNHYPKGLRRKN